MGDPASVGRSDIQLVIRLHDSHLVIFGLFACTRRIARLCMIRAQGPNEQSTLRVHAVKLARPYRIAIALLIGYFPLLSSIAILRRSSGYYPTWLFRRSSQFTAYLHISKDFWSILSGGLAWQSVDQMSYIRPLLKLVASKKF